MEEIYINNLNDSNSFYQSFKNDNPGKGGLKIRAYGANEAVPISNLKVVVSTVYKDKKLIFFDGATDDSGVIEKIELPAPKSNLDDLVIPKSITYSIDAIYTPDNIKYDFYVDMYDGIYVLQNIGIIPYVKERENGN